MWCYFLVASVGVHVRLSRTDYVNEYRHTFHTYPDILHIMRILQPDVDQNARVSNRSQHCYNVLNIGEVATMNAR